MVATEQSLLGEKNAVDGGVRPHMFREDVLLYVLAGLIGLLSGLAAVVFDKMIHVVDGFLYGSSSFAGLYRGSAVLLFVFPAAGALLVGLIARFYSREAVGHGVPEVMDAIVRREGKIKFHVALARMLTCALTVGSGGSAGAEGPIVQIGAAIASSTGSLFGVVRHHFPILIACGAAAGIAAIFHAPIAGVLLAIEVLLRDINHRTLAPVLIAAVISSITASSLLGQRIAIFPLGDMTVYRFHWNELGNYIVLGLLCAVVAILFIRILYAVEEFFERLSVTVVLKPVLGALGLGLTGLLTILLIRTTLRGEPIIFGNSYSFIGLCIGTASADQFSGFELSFGVLLILLVAKIIATSLTLGSGGSGGVFAPSLFMGATTGYAFGLGMRQIPIFSDVSPQTYSLVGMASMIAASTHAPMASIVMLFEITHNYAIILPVMFSSTVALLISRTFSADSIETFRLHRLGIEFGMHARTRLLRRYSVRDIMRPGVVTICAGMSLQKIVQTTADKETSNFIVVDDNGCYCGLLCERDMCNVLLNPEVIPLIIGEDMVRSDVPIVAVDETLDKVLELFSRVEVNCLAVHDAAEPTRFVGMVTRADLMRRYMDALQAVG